jgi:DNA-binding response OmpR family regulator
MSRILIVEDEQHLADGLRFNLEAEGYQVQVIDTGEGALETLAKDPAFDVVVLDVMLPGKDGFTVMSELRQSGQFIPTLMLTARGHPDDVLRGFAAGADDYLTKPFAFEEFLARVRALLRRGGGAPAPVLRLADLTLDPATRAVKRAGRRIELTAREHTLLEYFLRNAGRVLTRPMLAQHVWGLDFDPESNIVDVYVGYLRRKIDGEGDRRLLHTLRGSGYKLAAEE